MFILGPLSRAPRREKYTYDREHIGFVAYIFVTIVVLEKN